MSSPARPPWYRRPLPPRFPAWLVLSAVTAVAGGYLATWSRQPTAWTVAFGGAAGAFAGLVFSLAMAGGRGGRVPSPEVPQFRPPTWLALPVGVALLVLVAYFLIDDTLREGHSELSLRRGRHRMLLPGPVAVGVAGGCLVLAGVVSVAGVWLRPRAPALVVGGLLGIAVLVIGLYVILTRAWG